MAKVVSDLKEEKLYEELGLILPFGVLARAWRVSIVCETRVCEVDLYFGLAKDNDAFISSRQI